jgi:hypothetical protein
MLKWLLRNWSKLETLSLVTSKGATSHPELNKLDANPIQNAPTVVTSTFFINTNVEDEILLGAGGGGGVDVSNPKIIKFGM